MERNMFLYIIYFIQKRFQIIEIFDLMLSD
jgi:hypothetical protein